MKTLSYIWGEIKKSPFIPIVAIEIFFAFIAAAILFPDENYIYLYALPIFVAVLTPLFIWLKKTQDAKKKARIRLAIILIVALPIFAAAIRILLVVIALLLYFS